LLIDLAEVIRQVFLQFLQLLKSGIMTHLEKRIAKLTLTSEV